jgi:hypothetical protein
MKVTTAVPQHRQPLSTTFEVYAASAECPNARKLWELAMSRLLTGPSLYCAQRKNENRPLIVKQHISFKNVLQRGNRADTAGHTILNISMAESDFLERLAASNYLKMIVTVRLETEDILVTPVYTTTDYAIATEIGLCRLPKRNHRGIYVSPWYHILRNRLEEFNRIFGELRNKWSLIDDPQQCFVGQFVFVSDESSSDLLLDSGALYTFPFVFEKNEQGLFTINESTMDILLRRFCSGSGFVPPIKVRLEVFATQISPIIGYANVGQARPPKQDSYVVVPPQADDDDDSMVTFRRPDKIMSTTDKLVSDSA